MPAPDLLKVFNDAEKAKLSAMGWVVQPDLDIQRWRRLEAAYRASALRNASGFCCAAASGCTQAFGQMNSDLSIPADHRGTVGDFFGAYDLRYNGAPVRVCVVSLDSGSPTSDLYDHTKEIEGLRYCEIPRTWQHWRATLKLMNLIFCGDHDLNPNDIALPRRLFAHIRAIKCSAGRDWNQPAEMYRNCRPHLVEELNALEPTIIIAQGHSQDMSDRHPRVSLSVLDAMYKIAGNAGTGVYSLLVPAPPLTPRMMARQWQTPWGSTVVLATCHPGAGCWYSSREYGVLRNELIPAIITLRERGFALEP